MAYVYKHIRLDNDVIFYIGVGSDKGYYRANSKRSRNNHWCNVVNKVGYKVEIVYDNIDYDLALKKEIELIAFYKLIKDGGTLVNYTKGGQGQLGLTPPTAKPIFAQNLITKQIFSFSSIMEASNKLNIARANILKVLNDKQRYCKDYIFSYDKNTLNIEIRKIKNNAKGWIGDVSIYITNILNFNPIKYNSLSECAKLNPNFLINGLSKAKDNIQLKHKNHIVATSINELLIKFNNFKVKKESKISITKNEKNKVKWYNIYSNETIELSLTKMSEYSKLHVSVFSALKQGKQEKTKCGWTYLKE